MTFIEGAIFILEKNGNKPMTSNDIWKEISDLGLVDTKGKTPAASLNTIMLMQCLNTPMSLNEYQLKTNRAIFEIVTHGPMKYRLRNYMPSTIKETMKANGFITLDMLKEILEKNGINIKL